MEREQTRVNVPVQPQGYNINNGIPQASGPSLPSLTCQVGRQYSYAVWHVSSATVARPCNPLCRQQETPLLPPLRKPHPVCTITAIRAVAPAVVVIRNRPNHAIWKPC